MYCAMTAIVEIFSSSCILYTDFLWSCHLQGVMPTSPPTTNDIQNEVPKAKVVTDKLYTRETTTSETSLLGIISLLGHMNKRYMQQKIINLRSG